MRLISWMIWMSGQIVKYSFMTIFIVIASVLMIWGFVWMMQHAYSVDNVGALMGPFISISALIFFLGRASPAANKFVLTKMFYVMLLLFVIQCSVYITKNQFEITNLFVLIGISSSIATLPCAYLLMPKFRNYIKKSLSNKPR